MISYAPFWNTLKDKNITQYDLVSKHHLSTGTLDRLRKNQNVTLNTLQDLSKILDCKIQDIVEFIND